jgi:capsular polysaccharide biosynthesis protein
MPHQFSYLVRKAPHISIAGSQFFPTKSTAIKFLHKISQVSDYKYIESSRSLEALDEARNSKFLNAQSDLYILVPISQTNIYGHWLIDLIPGYLAMQRRTSKKVLILVDGPIPAFVGGILKFFNLTTDVVVSTLNQSDEIIYSITDYPIFRDYDFYNISDFRRLVAPQILLGLKSHTEVRSKKPEKYFLSRSQWRDTYHDSRSLINRDEVLDFFSHSGFEVVHPEDYTTIELISKLRNARIIAGEAGSAMHTSIFCSPQTRFINLQSMRQEHLIQSTLCAIIKQHITYIWGNNETEEWSSNYSIALNSLELCLNRGLLD